MGDVALPPGDSVTRRVRELLRQGLAQAGYAVSAEPATAATVAVSVRQFWSWMTPGFVALTFEVRIECLVTLRDRAGVHPLMVQGYGINHGQIAKNGNWLEAFDPAFQDFTKNLAAQVAALGLAAARFSAPGLPPGAARVLRRAFACARACAPERLSGVDSASGRSDCR